MKRDNKTAEKQLYRTLVALKTEHRSAELPVISERSAYDSAGQSVRAGRKRRAERRIAPTTAAVDTDVSAGPVVGQVARRFRRHFPARRNVGGEGRRNANGRHCESATADEHYFSHDQSPNANETIATPTNP